jgi:HD superfamily phosphohydrolase
MVADEIKRLETPPSSIGNDKIIDELLIEAAHLRQEAVALIAKLKAEGKHVEAEGLEKLEALVAKGADELKKLDEKSPLVKKAEEVLAKAEKDLADEIKRLEGPTVNEPADEIKKQVEAIKLAIKNELDKLAKAGRTKEGEQLVKLNGCADNIETQLVDARPDVLPVLQSYVDMLKLSVDDEIKRLEKPPSSVDDNDKIIDELLIEAAHLRQAAVALIDKLKAEGKHVEAAGLEKLEALVAKGADELKKLDEKSPLVKKAEEVLAKAEKDLADEIKRLEG